MEVLFRRKYEYHTTTYYQDFNTIPVKDDTVKESTDNLFGINVGVFNEELNGTEKHPYFKYLRQSNDVDEYVKNYGNQLTSVSVNRLTLVVEKNDDKVSIKLFMYDKNRQSGRPYFRKSSKMMFITYKFATNDLYCGSLINSFKKTRSGKSLKRNYFNNTFLSSVMSSFHNSYSFFKKNGNMNETAYEIFQMATNEFLKSIPNLTIIDDFTAEQMLYKHYLECRNIKKPDNYLSFMGKVPLPNKRTLKKFDNKLVETFMYNKKLKGDKIRKILHTCNFINEMFYEEVKEFFGEKLLRHQPYENLEIIFTNKNGYANLGDSSILSETEKKNAFQVFIQMLKSEKSLYTFSDHLSFYRRLKMFEEVKWKSKTPQEFIQEHQEWTDRHSHYTKGTYYREYDTEFINEIQRPISNINLIDYYPVVLTNSNEYNSESNRQNNCVKTYIDKASSLIISFREGSSDSEERATIEYLIELHNDTVRLRRVQSLGRFNNNLDVKWNLVIEELDNRINKFVNDRGFALPKVKVEINKNVIESISKFNDKNKYLSWVSPYLNGLTPLYDNILNF